MEADIVAAITLMPRTMLFGTQSSLMVTYGFTIWHRKPALLCTQGTVKFIEICNCTCCSACEMPYLSCSENLLLITSCGYWTSPDTSVSVLHLPYFRSYICSKHTWGDCPEVWCKTDKMDTAFLLPVECANMDLQSNVKIVAIKWTDIYVQARSLMPRSLSVLVAVK